MQLPSDAIAGLGYLALGTRLKRLAEQLQAGVAEVLGETGEAVQPGQLPLLVAIEEGGGLTVTQLVDAIAVSQPAISRMLEGLRRSGLVVMDADAEDARVRCARLTPNARHLLERLRVRSFPKVAAAAEQLCEGLDLLGKIAVIEQRNRELEFAERIRRAKP